MMYFLLILFFGSLLGITFMIGRKLLLIQNGQITYEDNNTEEFLRAQHLEELKHATLKAIKKHSYNGLVMTIRFYFRSVNFFKNKYQEVKIKIKSIHIKKLSDTEKKEVSKFLKLISEYKHKIREIKHRIKEEEENL